MAKKKNRAFDIGPEQEIVDGHVVEAPSTVINLNEDGVEVVTTAADEVERLTKVNADLTDKIAGYLEEIDKLKIKTDGAREKALQEEVDRLTLRVSELTFENANLACQLDELSKKMASSGSVPNQTQFSPNVAPPMQGKLRQPRTDAFNPYMNNGYGVWS